MFLFPYLLFRGVALIKIIGDMDVDCDHNYSYYSPHFCYNELCYSIFLLLLFSKTNLFSILLLSFRIQGYSSMGASYLDQLEILLTINSVDCLHQYQNQCHVRTYYFIDHRITLFCHILSFSPLSFIHTHILISFLNISYSNDDFPRAESTTLFS